jgi:hypothetical protein
LTRTADEEEGMAIELPGDLSAEGGEATITGIGQNPPLPLHHYWSLALRAAANTIDADEGPFTVETRVLLKHRSPGWVDGFIVKLGSGS